MCTFGIKKYDIVYSFKSPFESHFFIKLSRFYRSLTQELKVLFDR